MALGAVVSALGGNDAVSGALAAGGAEALVPLFSKAMYGTTDPEKLTAADKQNLSNMARLFGAAVGAATGNGAANGYADVAQGGMNAGNAVENNENMITAFGIHPNGAANLNRAQTFYESQIRAGKSVDEANQALRDYLTSCKDCQEWRDSTFVKATNGFVNAIVDGVLEPPREVADVISVGSNVVLKTDFPVNRSFIGKKAENGATILELTQDALFNAATVHPAVGAAVSSYNMGTAINEKDPEKFGRSVAGIAGSFITAKATGNPSYTVEFPGVQSSNLGMARWQRGSVSIPTVKKVSGNNTNTAKLSSKPEWLKERMEAGNAFNRQRAHAYPYNEIYIERNLNRANGEKTRYTRVDSYNPHKGEIVSRKFTQFSDIQTSTAVGYIKELTRKYTVGKSIANVPSSRNKGLVGKKLEGKYILEVPVQNKPIPIDILNEARKNNVIIRDVNGKIYK
jgi:hypothetical protein psyrptA_22346